MLSARNQVVGSGYSIILTFFQFQVWVYARTQTMFNQIVWNVPLRWIYKGDTAGCHDVCLTVCIMCNNLSNKVNGLVVDNQPLTDLVPLEEVVR